MKKITDNLIGILTCAAFIILLAAASFFHGQYLKNEIVSDLEKIKNAAISLIKVELKNSVLLNNSASSLFREPVISLNIEGMIVKPEIYKSRLLSGLETKFNRFDDEILNRLKIAVKTGPPETAAAVLSYYLNDNIDKYVHEKCVLYAYLIKLKTDMGISTENELESFKKLVSMLNENEDRKFLLNKLKNFISASGAHLKLELNDITGGVYMSGGIKDYNKVNNDGENEKLTALVLSIKNETLSLNPDTFNISVLTTGDNDNYIIASSGFTNDKNGGNSENNTNDENVITGGAANGKKAGKINNTIGSDSDIRAGRPEVFAAAIVDTDKLDGILKSKYGRHINLTTFTGRYFIDFRSPYKLSVNFFAFKRNYAVESLFYLPLAVILIVFYILKRRENEAFRLSINMTDFVSKISHQLKTPLSSSLLYLDLAGRYLGAGDMQNAKNALDSAHEQAEALSFLFENYSVLNRIFSENISLDIIEADIEAELILHLKSYKSLIENNELKIKFSFLEENKVLIDKWAFYNIISNLISNAIKYCGKKPVEIEFSARRKEYGGEFILTITDNGPGIKETDAVKIFDKFYKGEAASDDFRSSGLGLFIAAALAKKMGGKLELSRVSPFLKIEEGKNENDSGAQFLLYMRAAK